MPAVDFDHIEERLIAADFSDAVGATFLGEKVEAARVRFPKGQGTRPHSHPEEQVTLVLEGVLLVTVDGERFEVAPGRAFHVPPGREHAVEALSDVIAVAFKRRD